MIFLESLDESFVSAWSGDPDPVEQAQLLQSFGERIASVCSAIARADELPPEVTGYHSLLREAARVRHAWVLAAVDELRCCGTATVSDIANGNTQTSGVVRSLRPEAHILLDTHDASPAVSRPFMDEVIGIELALEDGWIASDNGLTPVLYAPFDLNRSVVTETGPRRWGQGTAIRVRRLRNPEPVNPDTASTRFISLITQQGDVASVEEASVDGLAALEHNLMPEDNEWAASVTVFVSGEFTYFLETGCPTDVAGACAATQRVADSLRLTN